MSETAVRLAQDEMTIDLRQMGYFVLKKWKILLIFIIVGLLLGTGLTLLKGETTLESFDTTKMDNERIQQYALYNQLYLDRLKYDRGSVIIRMDPNAVYSGSLRYYITADTVSIDFIANLFRNIMYDESIFEEIKEKAKLTTDLQYIRELVGLGVSVAKEDNIQIASAAELSRIPASATISVSAMARSEETCEAMLEVMRSRIAAVDAECEASYAQYTFLPMSDRIVYGYSASVANTQKEAASLKNDYVTQIKTIEEELTQDELDYFTLAYPTLTDKVLETSLLSRLKYPILLSALLFFLAVGWYAVRFVLDNHLKTPLEVRDIYGLRLIASRAPQKSPRRGIDGWLDRHGSKGAPPVNSREYLLGALQTSDAQRIVLCGDLADEALREEIAWLAEQDSRIHFAGPLETDEHALVQAKASDAVVLVMRLWHTTHPQIQREIEISRSSKVPLLGAVVMDE